MRLLTFQSQNATFLCIYKQLFLHYIINQVMSEQISNRCAFKNRNQFLKNLKVDTGRTKVQSKAKKPNDQNIFQQIVTTSSKKRRQTIGAIEIKQSFCQFNEKHISQKFDELYEKKVIIGQGAHSTVYQCQDKKTKKRFAVKIMKNCQFELLKDIKRSFLVLKQLNHPYILKAQNLFIEEATSKCYMTTQICDFPQLRKFMVGNRVPQQKVSIIVKKLLLALKYMKQKGVCHRDIKPENILYNPQTDQVRIVDFQLAKMKNYSHQTISLWSLTGTIYYRAPESFAIGYGESVDLWAIGVIAYQMLVGQLPFYSNSLKTVTDHIFSKQIDFDSLQISNEAKRFLKGMLDKDAKTRYTPNQALRSSFILKNSHLKTLTQIQNVSEKIKWQYSLDEPCFKKSNTTIQDKNEKYKFYDEDFASHVLRSPTKDNGIRIIY